MTKSSTSCRRCKRWLEGEWNVAETTEHRAVLQQAMDQGYCNICLPDRRDIEKLRAKLDKQELKWTPKTVVHSGGHPAPVVPNCIGPSGTGDCREQWRIDPTTTPKSEWAALELEHQLTHTTAHQRWHLADVQIKRNILALHFNRNDYCNECGGGWPCATLRCLIEED